MRSLARRRVVAGDSWPVVWLGGLGVRNLVASCAADRFDPPSRDSATTDLHQTRTPDD